MTIVHIAEDALYASLPGATIDQLLAELMIRGAARLRVRMPQANLPVTGCEVTV